jgi:hypothetical protein
MTEDSGFTNWETERMFQRAVAHFGLERTERTVRPVPRELLSFETFVAALRPLEGSIKKEGIKSFTLYLEDPVNYWEVFVRAALRVLASRAGPSSSKTNGWRT